MVRAIVFKSSPGLGHNAGLPKDALDLFAYWAYSLFIWSCAGELIAYSSSCAEEIVLFEGL